MFCNRTLQGARPPKGQELEDPLLLARSKTRAALLRIWSWSCSDSGFQRRRDTTSRPNQFELAPIYEPANVAADHNQLLMEVMKKSVSVTIWRFCSAKNRSPGSMGRASTSTIGW